MPQSRKACSNLKFRAAFAKEPPHFGVVPAINACMCACSNECTRTFVSLCAYVCVCIGAHIRACRYLVQAVTAQQEGTRIQANSEARKRSRKRRQCLQILSGRTPQVMWTPQMVSGQMPSSLYIWPLADSCSVPDHVPTCIDVQRKYSRTSKCARARRQALLRTRAHTKYLAMALAIASGSICLLLLVAA